MWLLEEAVRKGYPDEIVTLFFLVAEVPAIGTTSSVSSFVCVSAFAF